MAQVRNTEIDKLLEIQSGNDTLRFITCGSIDDGKSTLIGRLLYETDRIFLDQLTALKNASEKHGTQGDKIDLALLLDGLSAEQEQGITIDVAYRFFSTPRRRFIVADTPGHEEYTRNMVTGASTANLAVLLVDASRGLLDQTNRHLHIVSLLGVKNIVVAVNKMDLVGFDESVYEKIKTDFQDISSSLSFHSKAIIPLSALNGDNVVKKSSSMPWYTRASLLEYLETISVEKASRTNDLSMPIQWVNRRSSKYRGYAGMISSGTVKVGDEIKILPSGKAARVREILLGRDVLASAEDGMSIAISLDKELDISRGDVLVSIDSEIACSDQFSASMVWMGANKGFVGRPYWMLIGSAKVGATITNMKYKFRPADLSRLPASDVEVNDIAYITVKTDRPVPFTTYKKNRTMGGFALVDRYDFSTVAIGMIDYALRRAGNLISTKSKVNRSAREALNGHSGKVFWMTGLSGSGKSTIANAFELALYKQGIRAYILDGDNVRLGLNRDLGFTDSDRIENIRRVAETAKLMVDAGIVVITSFISPFKPERDMARKLFATDDFVEVFVDTPLRIAEQRDPKGLYLKARNGELPNFTGVDSVYEAPERPEVHLKTSILTVDESVTQLMKHFSDNKL